MATKSDLKYYLSNSVGRDITIYIGDRLEFADIYNKFKNFNSRDIRIGFSTDEPAFPMEDYGFLPTHHIDFFNSYADYSSAFICRHRIMPNKTPFQSSSNINLKTHDKEAGTKWYCEHILNNPQLINFVDLRSISTQIRGFGTDLASFTLQFNFDLDGGETAKRYIVERLFRLFGTYVYFYRLPDDKLKQHLPSLQRLSLAQIMKTGTPEEKNEAMYRNFYTEDKHIPHSAAIALEESRNIEREMNAVDSLATAIDEKGKKRRSSRSRSPLPPRRRSSRVRKSRRVDT